MGTCLLWRVATLVGMGLVAWVAYSWFAQAALEPLSRVLGG